MHLLLRPMREKMHINREYEQTKKTDVSEIKTNQMDMGMDHHPWGRMHILVPK